MPSTTFGQGFWRLADPKISLASFASMGLGLAAASAGGPIDWGWFAVTLLGVFAIEVAKNASGEVVDFESGVDLAVLPEDRSPFSGGKRVIVDQLLTRRQTTGIAVTCHLLGILAGLVIVAWREPGVLWIGVAGVVIAHFYHGAPFRLAYRGLGEIAVAIAYGPLIFAGTYLVPRRALLGAIAVAPAGTAARLLRDSPEDMTRIIPAQARTLLAFLLYALGAGIGVVVV